MVQLAVIELGTDFEPVEREQRPVPAWWRRGWALTGYAALLLLLLGPPLPIKPSLLVPVTTIPGGRWINYELSSDTLYTAWYPFQQATLATFDAYRLSDGSLRWRVPLPVNTSNLVIRSAGNDTVVVSSLEPAASGDRTVAYDTLTGRLLWDSRLPLLPAVPASSVVVLAAYLRPDGGVALSPAVPGAASGVAARMLLEGLNVRSGRISWSVLVPEGSRAALPSGGGSEGDPDGRYAVILGPDGLARSVDLVWGSVTDPHPVHAGTGATVSGHWLLVGYRDGATPVLAAYRADTLRPQWTGPVPSLDLVASACGELTCLSDAAGTRAVDLATGRVAWTSMAWQSVGTLGGWVYALPQGRQPGAVTLLAPASGAPVLSLAGWALVPGPMTSPYLVHSTRPAWLGVVRTRAGVPEVDTLGSLVDPSVNGCAAVPEFLVCGTDDRRLRLWRYRG